MTARYYHRSLDLIVRTGADDTERKTNLSLDPRNSNQDPNRFQDSNMLSFSPVGVAIRDISGWKLYRLNTNDLPTSQEGQRIRFLLYDPPIN